MSAPGERAPVVSPDALIAARLCSIDPIFGGMILRGDHVARDAVIAALRVAMPGAAQRRLPAHADDEALLGGIDLAATLAGGRPVMRSGLLAAGGMLIAPMAERMGEATAGLIAQAIDAGASPIIVALDDGAGEDEHVARALGERLAFHLDLHDRHAEPEDALSSPAEVIDEDALCRALAAAGAALGVDSARASMFALRAARGIARIEGRVAVIAADAARAARLVFAPRATRLPETAPPPPEPEAEGEAAAGDPRPLDDIVLDAVRTAIPADVLARIAAGKGRGRASGARGAGERRRSPSRGRPSGVRAGVPRGGLRLALVDTLRAAAPWQKLRGRDDARIRILRDDLRVRRFEARAQATTIFAVDASGSAALARLAEAKGAVELLLAQAYVKRTHVALVAFRGAGAETLLPPTRSLARARRLLADLPGGGGTPLAAGLAAAHDLALAARARGQTPAIVVLTDGRANVARDGGRDAAIVDAEAAARAIAAAGIAGVFVDTAPRPRPEGERLAAAMAARYLPLPRADAAALHRAITAAHP